jgi:heme exporter protein C
MRQRILMGLLALAGILIIRNLYVILLQLPDEAAQGPIWRIFTFHLPAAITSASGFTLALVASGLYLWRRDLRLDAAAAAITEVSFMYALVTLFTGMIWARIIWGIWWTWDPRLTSYFICLLIYGGYLMLRRAVDEPTTRARLSAVLSVFGFIDYIIVWKSIEWWRTQHPGPVLSLRTGGGNIDPAMEAATWWNVLALGTVAVVLVVMRLRQEELRREVDALRRFAHSL